MALLVNKAVYNVLDNGHHRVLQVPRLMNGSSASIPLNKRPSLLLQDYVQPLVRLHRISYLSCDLKQHWPWPFTTWTPKCELSQAFRLSYKPTQTKRNATTS